MHFNNLSIKDAFHLFSNLKHFSSLSYFKTTTVPAEHEHQAPSVLGENHKNHGLNENDMNNKSGTVYIDLSVT